MVLNGFEANLDHAWLGHGCVRCLGAMFGCMVACVRGLGALLREMVGCDVCNLLHSFQVL